jgi:trans-2,3-dihydro-3-hydroxyanthranilate isomerase
MERIGACLISLAARIAYLQAPCYRAAVQLSYVTVDVFSSEIFGGNPLAVVLDAQTLSAPQMQSIAAEFGYSETTFILPARQSGTDAHVRIFTPRTEVPFAGHPNVGTAVVFARELEARGTRLEQLVFEEAGGLVPIRILREGHGVAGAELTAPQPLSIGSTVAIEDAAACLSLAASEISCTTHPPQVLSVGLPFLVVELISRDALRRAKPNSAAHERLLPPAGTDSVFAYFREPDVNSLHARMFSPLDAIVEDPATGSACAATIALLASKRADANADWHIEQGVDMGRPSLIRGRTERRAGGSRHVHIAGHAVTVMRGTLRLAP